MKDQTSNTEDILKKVSRRGVQLTPDQLEQAAENLRRLRAWVTELYLLTLEYDDAVFNDLNSTKMNSWTNFLVDIFIDMAFAAAAGAAIASGGAAAVPAFAFISAILHDWGFGKDTPGNLGETFSKFQFGHNAMQIALDQKLGSLTDVGNNYENLQTAWKDDIEFNGATYTIGDLASSHFPDKNRDGDAYNKLQTAALTSFHKSVWNLVIMKCCTLYRHYGSWEDTPMKPAGVLLSLARDTLYKKHKGSYLRAEMYSYGGITQDSIRWTIYQYDLGIGGYPFPDVAASKLFMDDTPGHIINAGGLFPRDYVFKQFSITKPDLSYGHELGNDQIGNLNPNADDWNFVGGAFPLLIK